MKAPHVFLLATAFLGVLISGCTSAQKESTSEEAETSTTDTTFVNIEGEVQLNNGAKWVANAETTAGVAHMQEQIAAFRALNLPEDTATFSALGRGLNTTFKAIFEQCTMTGAAHEELHDFLLPIMGYTKALKGADVPAAKQALDDLERHLARYEEFFES